jgi:hypothetical protein
MAKRFQMPEFIKVDAPLGPPPGSGPPRTKFSRRIWIAIGIIPAILVVICVLIGALLWQPDRQHDFSLDSLYISNALSPEKVHLMGDSINRLHPEIVSPESAEKIQNLLSSIHAAGEPATMDELRKAYPTFEPKENAALQLDEAINRRAFEDFATLRAPYLDMTINTGHSHSWSFWERLAARELVKKHGPALSEAHEILAMTTSAYPRRFDVTYEHVAHYGKFQFVADAFVCAAVYDADFGGGENAAINLGDALRVAGTLKLEPDTRAHISRSMIHWSVGSGLEEILSRHSLSNGDLDALNMAFQSERTNDYVEHGLVGERCVQIAPYVSVDEHDGTITVKQSADGRLPNGGTNACINTNRLIEACRLPIPERTKAIEALGIENLNMRGVPHMDGDFYKFRATYSPLDDYVVDHLALDKAICVLSVEKYRNDKKSLPDNLSQLIPEYLSEIPLDPFDGQPMRYKKTAKGYVVYSIWRDRVDNGGQEKSGPNKQVDSVFVVERR